MSGDTHVFPVVDTSTRDTFSEFVPEWKTVAGDHYSTALPRPSLLPFAPPRPSVDEALPEHARTSSCGVGDDDDDPFKHGDGIQAYAHKAESVGSVKERPKKPRMRRQFFMSTAPSQMDEQIDPAPLIQLPEWWLKAFVHSRWSFIVPTISVLLNMYISFTDIFLHDGLVAVDYIVTGIFFISFASRMNRRTCALLVRSYDWWYLNVNSLLHVVASVYSLSQDPNGNSDRIRTSFYVSIPLFVCVSLFTHSMDALPVSTVTKIIFMALWLLNTVRLFVFTSGWYPAELCLVYCGLATNMRLAALVPLAAFQFKYLISLYFHPSLLLIVSCPIGFHIVRETVQKDAVRRRVETTAFLDDMEDSRSAHPSTGRPLSSGSAQVETHEPQDVLDRQSSAPPELSTQNSSGVTVELPVNDKGTRQDRSSSWEELSVSRPESKEQEQEQEQAQQQGRLPATQEPEAASAPVKTGFEFRQHQRTIVRRSSIANTDPLHYLIPTIQPRTSQVETYFRLPALWKVLRTPLGFVVPAIIMVDLVIMFDHPIEDLWLLLVLTLGLVFVTLACVSLMDRKTSLALTKSFRFAYIYFLLLLYCTAEVMNGISVKDDDALRVTLLFYTSVHALVYTTNVFLMDAWVLVQWRLKVPLTLIGLFYYLMVIVLDLTRPVDVPGIDVCFLYCASSETLRLSLAFQLFLWNLRIVYSVCYYPNQFCLLTAPYESSLLMPNAEQKHREITSAVENGAAGDSKDRALMEWRRFHAQHSGSAQSVISDNRSNSADTDSDGEDGGPTAVEVPLEEILSHAGAPPPSRQASSPRGSQGSVSLGSYGSAGKDLPPGWEIHPHEDTGVPYYFNVHTKEATWEKPVLPK